MHLSLCLLLHSPSNLCFHAFGEHRFEPPILSNRGTKTGLVSDAEEELRGRAHSIVDESGIWLVPLAPMFRIKIEK